MQKPFCEIRPPHVEHEALPPSLLFCKESPTCQEVAEGLALYVPLRHSVEAAHTPEHDRQRQILRPTQLFAQHVAKRSRLVRRNVDARPDVGHCQCKLPKPTRDVGEGNRGFPGPPEALFMTERISVHECQLDDLQPDVVWEYID
ncbi:hypothetical protein NM688_g8372 [Phlebia brevispora]|uniref:Uncharacterized protein n=1 Tax=Phlebia brevispora TaxID=194682 RepID=A0ACC1RTW7_9APHY|nr:hypothetical protein NM688_g8372 [Phlebia brevispora]